MDTLEQRYLRWMRGRFSEATQHTYRSLWRTYRRECPGFPTRCTTEDLMRVWNRGISPAAQQRERIVLGAIYKYFLGWKKNPAEGIPRVRVHKRKPRFYPEDFRQKYLEAAFLLGPRSFAIACLGVYAGLRRAEVAELPWESMRDSSLYIFGKGSKERVVLMHPDLKKALMDWRLSQDTPSPWVFPGYMGRHLTPVTVGKLHHVILKTAGLYTGEPRKNGFHRTRHTAATAHFRAGRNVMKTQRFLGHSSWDTTMVYVGLVEDEEDEGVLQMYRT